jgi:hypothetical protein
VRAPGAPLAHYRTLVVQYRSNALARVDEPPVGFDQRCDMIDRMLSTTLNLTVVAVIAVATVGTLMCGYWGLIQLFNGNPTAGGFAAAGSILPGIIAFKLAHYRNDLVDR